MVASPIKIIADEQGLKSTVCLIHSSVDADLAANSLITSLHSEFKFPEAKTQLVSFLLMDGYTPFYSGSQPLQKARNVFGPCIA